MKGGWKPFKHNIEVTLPEWREMLLSYKELKKLIRKIPESGNAEEEFLSLLSNDIDMLNAFLVEKEEEFIIRLKELQQNLKKAFDLWGLNGGSQPSETDYKERMDILIKDIVDLHSEMVLLLNFCNINHRGLAKLVKKYDKRTGGLQRFPFLQKVIEQPFLTSEIIPKLVSECESIIDEVSQVGDEKPKTSSEAIALDGEPLLTTKQDTAIVVKEGDVVSEPNLEKSLIALGKY